MSRAFLDWLLNKYSGYDLHEWQLYPEKCWVLWGYMMGWSTSSMRSPGKSSPKCGCKNSTWCTSKCPTAIWHSMSFCGVLGPILTPLRLKSSSFLTKINDTIPMAFPHCYEEALKDEEERSKVRVAVSEIGQAGPGSGPILESISFFCPKWNLREIFHSGFEVSSQNVLSNG